MQSLRPLELWLPHSAILDLVQLCLIALVRLSMLDGKLLLARSLKKAECCRPWLRPGRLLGLLLAVGLALVHFRPAWHRLLVLNLSVPHARQGLRHVRVERWVSVAWYNRPQWCWVRDDLLSFRPRSTRLCGPRGGAELVKGSLLERCNPRRVFLTVCSAHEQVTGNRLLLMT